MKKENKPVTDPFDKCSNLVVSKMKSPGIFLLSLTQMLSNTHDHPPAEGAGPHFYLITMVEDIYLPWANNNLSLMSAGFERIYSYGHGEEFQKHVCSLLVSYSQELGIDCIPFDEDLDRDLKFIGLMQKIANEFHEIDCKEFIAKHATS